MTGGRGLISNIPSRTIQTKLVTPGGVDESVIARSAATWQCNAMQLIRTLPTQADRPTAVAIGNFDGLHAGHRAVLQTMLQAAQARALVPSVLTFEPHPRQLFAPHSAPFRLEPLAMKLARMRDAGVARVYMPRFNRRFADITAEDFLQQVLGQAMGAAAVVTGENFMFGHARRGTTTLLQAWGDAQGVQVYRVPPVQADGGALCSSSAVRQALAQGDMARASLLLGRPYRIAGRIRHGDGRGAGMGFATANLALPPSCLWPHHGVYAVRAQVGQGWHDGVANLGVRPSVSQAGIASLEVHLFDMQAMLYGQKMAVDFYGFVRAEQKFDSLAALTAQIARDCATARTLLAREGQ